MIKLLLCLVLTCFQAFALTQVPSLNGTPIDPDHTDWDNVTVTVTDVTEIDQSIGKFFDNRVLYNYTHSEIIYEKGLHFHQVQTLYFTVVGHQLFNITLVGDFVNYFYIVQLQDNYSKKIYEQIMTFQFVTSDAFDPANCRVDDVTTTPDPVIPPIKQWQLNFKNTTEVTFDLLAVLWNSTLIDGARKAANAYLTNEINTEIGLGNYTSVDIPLENVDIDNSDLKFYWGGNVWQDAAQTYFKGYELDFQLNVEDGSITIVNSHLDDKWIHYFFNL